MTDATTNHCRDVREREDTASGERESERGRTQQPTTAVSGDSDGVR